MANFGYLEYEFEESILKATRLLNDYSLLGKKI